MGVSKNTTQPMAQHLTDDAVTVPSGYKWTEVGVIPEDWGVDRIGSLASIKTGARNTQDRKDDAQYPFFVRSQEMERIDTYSFDGEAVLTAGDGVGTGKVFHYIQGRFDYHQRVYKISDFSSRLNGFYFYLYFSNHFYGRIASMTAKTSVDSVRMNMIADMAIPLPPESEQRTIATTLSDVDGMIGALDKLIAKKRAIKQAAMQQLLTGKTRVPGFGKSAEHKDTVLGVIPEDWGVKRLGDVLKVRHGKSQHAIVAVDGKYPILATSGEIGRTNQFLCERPSVLIGRKGTIDFPQYVETPFWTIDTLFYTDVSSEADAKFLRGHWADVANIYFLCKPPQSSQRKSPLLQSL